MGIFAFHVPGRMTVAKLDQAKNLASAEWYL